MKISRETRAPFAPKNGAYMIERACEMENQKKKI